MKSLFYPLLIQIPLTSPEGTTILMICTFLLYYFPFNTNIHVHKQYIGLFSMLFSIFFILLYFCDTATLNHINQYIHLTTL